MADGNAPNRIILRRILYRIDFQLITERMQEELFAFVGQEFGEFFSYQQQEMENAIGFEIDVNKIEQSIENQMAQPVRVNQKAQPVFVFSHPQTPDSDGRQLKIGRTFLFLEVNLNLKTMGIPYYEWMSKIVEKLKENPMFRLSRIGLRKFNSFYVLEKNKEILKDMFSIDYLSEVEPAEFVLDRFENMQVYNNMPYTLQFFRTYSSGNLKNEQLNIENEPAHMIAFDFDLFTTDLDEMGLFMADAQAGLKKMNDSIYKFFEKVVAEKIVGRINEGDLLQEYGIIPF